MEATGCERPTIDLRIEPKDARLGFQTTELAVFNFEQRDLSKRSHRKFECTRFRWRARESQSARSVSLQRKSLYQRLQFIDASADASGLWQSKRLGRLAFLRLGRKRRRANIQKFGEPEARARERALRRLAIASG